MRRLIASGLLAVVGVLGLEVTASAQEIQLTGPLAGAPAVKKLRWHRNKRWEVAPAVSFTLLDEYQRTILTGLRVQYHLTDWLGLGVWGAYGAVHMNTALTDEIESVNKARWDPDLDSEGRTRVDRNASLLSVGYNFPNQLGQIQWIAAPQITAVPFRGKLALFEKVFLDTDMYFFAGPAFIGVNERADYSVDDLANPDKTVLDQGRPVKSYPMASRVAIAPTFGLGLTFFPGSWSGIGIEYRAVPFAWNASGFDSRGGPPDETGPDFAVDSKDRDFVFNQMVTVSFNIYLPTKLEVSP